MVDDNIHMSKGIADIARLHLMSSERFHKYY